MTTTQLSSKQDIVDFFTNNWNVPATAKPNESLRLQVYSEEGYSWESEDEFPLRNIKCTGFASQYSLNASQTVTYVPGASQPTNAGSLNSLLQSTTYTSQWNYIGWIESYSETGTYTVELTLWFADGTSESITKNIVVQKDIIATATSTVSKGRSETQSTLLYPYSVYKGKYKSNGFAELDIGQVSFDISEEAYDYGWEYGDDLLFYVYPTSDIETLLNDIEYAGFIDTDYGINADIVKTHGTNSVIIAYVTGLDVSYSGNVVTLNGNDYFWMDSNEFQSVNTLQFVNNHSRSDLIPGHTYQINAEYVENNKYEHSENIGTLEMLKCNTTTTITGNSTVYAGENLTLTITVKENKNNTSLSRGYITVYDGENIVQSNHRITGDSTEIVFYSDVPGTHNIYAIFTDSGVEYNSSSSNHLQVTVQQNKVDTVIRLDKVKSTTSNNEYEINYVDDKLLVPMPMYDTIEIQGIVVDSEDVTLPNMTVILKEYDGTNLTSTATDSGGNFVCEYTFENEGANHHPIHIVSTETEQYTPGNIDIELTNDYLPDFTDMEIIISTGVMGTTYKFLTPLEKSRNELIEEGVSLPQFLSLYDAYNYLCIISVDGNIIQNSGKKYYARYRTFPDGIYIYLGYIDQSYLFKEGQHYMFLAEMGIYNEEFIMKDINYDNDAQTVLEENYPDILSELEARLDTYQP